MDPLGVRRASFKRGNLLQRLQSRETLRGRPSTSCLQTRKFYQNIFPNHAVYNVEVPNCHIKKFTSDGEYLLCFTKNLEGIQLYHFRGFPDKTKGEAAEQIEKKFDTYFTFVYERFLTSSNETLNRDFCLQTSCGNYFILASSGPSAQPPSSPSHNANNTTTTTTFTIPPPTFSPQDASLSDSSFSIPPPPSFSNIPADTNPTFVGMSNLEDITFYLVGVKDGQVHSKRTFKHDYIHLSHHAGVYLYDDLFAVLSLQTQSIHMFQIKGNQFIDVRSIGHQCHEDDDMELARQYESERQYESHVCKSKDEEMDCGPCEEPMDSSPLPLLSSSISCQQYLTQQELQLKGSGTIPLQITTEAIVTRAGPIVGIKQRLLSFLFRKAKESSEPSKALSLFYQQFVQYSSLVMWKMQLLDESHLLIKFGGVDGALLRGVDSSNQTAFFVVYNMYSTDIVGVYENSNKEFAQTFEQFCEHFRACSCPDGLIKYRSTCSNNGFVREHLMKQKQAVASARNGGEIQAVKRILSALPFSPQSCSESPYFDRSLFTYDEKIISSTERPKLCPEYPVKFYSRSSGQVQFKLSSNSPDPLPSSSSSSSSSTSLPSSSISPPSLSDRSTKKYASYVFHPFYPFILSVQHVLFQPSIVNFHFRSEDS